MGRQWSEHLMERYFKPEDHPFRIFDNRIASLTHQHFTVVDAGCGANAPLLVSLLGKADSLIGIDLVRFNPSLRNESLLLLNNDLTNMEIEDASVDLVISRSVLEHLCDVESVYREIHRILRPGGRFLFLIPNFWDYVSIMSYLIPNGFHKAVVEKLSGRPQADTFPTYYKSNTQRAIGSLAKQTGFNVISLDYYGQYPYMLKFSSVLFSMGIVYDKIITRFSCLKYLRGWILAELQKQD